jgi:hypothetical protein
VRRRHVRSRKAGGRLPRLGLVQPADPSGSSRTAVAGALAAQISPNKSMRFRCTTAAFTLSAEPLGFVVWCQLARRPSLLCGSRSSARNFALGLPSGKPSRSCPCPRLVVILIASSSPTADFHRISSCPCRAYTGRCTRLCYSGLRPLPRAGELQG